MSELSTRLHLRRKELGLSQEELASAWAIGQILHYQAGKRHQRPAAVQGGRAGSRVGDHPAYLLGLDTPCPPPGFEPLPVMTQVPLIGSIACGTPITAEQNIERYIGVPAAWRADFALTCHGDSMSPPSATATSYAFAASRRWSRARSPQCALAARPPSSTSIGRVML